MSKEKKQFWGKPNLHEHLTKTTTALRLLVEYLVTNKILPTYYRELTIKHERRLDRANEKKARAFCYVQEEDFQIHCAYALENVLPTVRLGILLHEIGHIRLNAFHEEEGDDDFEVDVDSWILKNLPEAEYTYADHTYPALGKSGVRKAKNLQRISGDFKRSVYDVQ